MKSSMILKKWVTLLGVLALVAASCGSGTSEVAEPADDATQAAAQTGSDDSAAPVEKPTVVVTTNILGDVVQNLVGDTMNVVTIMPVGADPHDFQPSAQEVAQMGEADALIVNGGSFEEGLLDVIESAEGDGVPVYEAISAVSTIEYGEGGHSDHHDDHGDDHDDHGDEDKDHDDHGDDHDDHGDEDKDHDHDDDHGDDHDDHGDEDKDHDDHGDDHDDHGDEDKDHDDHGDDHDDHGDEDKDHDDHGDEDKDHDDHGDDHDDHHGHDHSGVDPHFFTDPGRVAVSAQGIADFLGGIDGVDADALNASAAEYVADLQTLDGEVESILSKVPEDKRVLITNHQVFGYLAEHYGFEVVGAVIPSGSTSDSANARDLAELAELIETEGVPAIFSDFSASDELTQTLADEVGNVAVVELFSESLGGPGSGGATYMEMAKTNAQRIADALSA